MQTSEHPRDAGDRGGPGLRGVYARRPDGISERRRGGRRFRQDGPRLRNSRQVRSALNQLARGMSKPSKAHVEAAKRLLRYLAGSTDFIPYKQ